MPMNLFQQMQTPEQVGRLVEQGSFLLKSFHEEADKDKDSNLTAFWKGELISFSNLVNSVFENNSSYLFNDIRRQTGLLFPGEV